MSDSSASADQQRRDQLAEALAAVQQRIVAACAAAGRDPAGVTTVVITKYFPAADIEHLAALGASDVGENKDQEAAAKVAELAPPVRQDVRWHFVGQLQTNKARSVVRYADLVHSVDRAKLVRALDRATGSALEAGERAGAAALPVLLQVDLEEGERRGRGGALPEHLDQLADTAAAAEHLELRGLMAVAPPGLDEAGTAAAFARLQQYAARLRESHPSADLLSAGMSADLEHGIRHGATHLRIGSAILGPRPGP